MNYYPVPKKYIRNIKKNNESGYFWENRQDRFHCGIDIYAPILTKVYSVDSGKVINAGVFTSPKDVYYWNKTYFLDIKNQKGLVYRFAELDNITVKKEYNVKAGELIGYVGQVLNKSKIDRKAPKYIQNLKEKQNLSMLHFEIYKDCPINSEKYFGGNWFGKKRPLNLLDPTDFFLKK